MPKNAVFVFSLASWSDYSYTLWQYVIKLIQFQIYGVRLRNHHVREKGEIISSEKFYKEFEFAE